MKGLAIHALPIPAILMLFAGCSPSMEISVSNPYEGDRRGEVVEIDAAGITGRFGSEFHVSTADGRQLTHQLTHDGKLLVEADFPAGTTTRLRIRSGAPAHADTVCVGQIRYDFQDDFTWENDRGGYRLYGPAYRNGGGNVSGYDIWTKSVTFPVLSQRYHEHCRRGISYHKDHGNGMDAYIVGHTLGAGMNALVDADGNVCYPCAYEKCEIKDNGPLRTTALITCYPSVVGPDSGVVERRVITLDKGSWLNRTVVSYEGLSSPCPIVTGIVIHRQNRHGYVADPSGRFMAYADLTDNPDNGNGVIYIGTVNKAVPDSVGCIQFGQPQGDAIGELRSHAVYSPGDEYVYFWGSGWSKGGVPGMQAWESYLADFHDRLKHPLKITVK